MHRLKLFLSVTILVLFVSSIAIAQDESKKQAPPPPPRPSVNNELYVPYWTLEPGWHSEVELRNNRQVPMTVTPVVRTNSGNEVTLDPVSIPAGEISSVDLHEALMSKAPELVGCTLCYGSVSLQYSSPFLHNLYAAAMVHFEGKPIAFHFDAGGSEPAMDEGTRESIWWLPTETSDSQLIIANASSKPASIDTVLFDSAGKRYVTSAQLGPRQTLRYSGRELVTASGLLGTVGGVRVVVKKGSQSVFVTHIAYDTSSGFSALLKTFEDNPSDAIEPITLRAPMMALSSPDPALHLPQDVKLEPKIFLRNTRGNALALTGEVYWHGESTRGVTALGDIQLAPNEMRTVDLGELQSRGVIPKDAPWAYVRLRYTGRYGDLVAIAASYAPSTEYGLQTPFSDIVGSQWVGSKWYADPLRNSILSVGNALDKPATVEFTIHYTGGKYEGERLLAPGEQLWVDMDKTIRNQVPDKNGNAIPPSVTSGSWTVRNKDNPLDPALFEGKLTIDKTYGHASYGCGNCCSPADPYMSPDPFSGLVGDYWPNTLWGWNQCDDTYWDVTGNAYNWSTTNSSVLTVSSTGMSHGVGAGSAGVSTFIYAPVGYMYKCPYQTQHPGSSGTVKPVISGPNTVWWFNGQNPNSSTWPTQITLSTSASGTWAVTSGSSYVHLSSTSGSSITVQGTGAFSQAANDVRITVTVNNVTSDAFTLTSKGPTISHTSDNPSASCVTGSQGWRNDVTYTVLDNLGNPMPGAPVSEGITATGLTWPAPTPMGGAADSNGRVTDRIQVCAVPPNGLTPMPQNYTGGSGTTVVDQVPQTLCVGSTTSSTSCTGALVQSDHQKRYLDHGIVTIP